MKYSLVGAFVSGIAILAAPAFAGFVSRADTPPRKIVVASSLADFHGNLDDRLQLANQLIDEAAQAAAKEYAGRGLDLMVFPEFAFASADGASAAQAVPLEGKLHEALAAMAGRHHAWIVAGTTLQEKDRSSNAAVLIDRVGKVAGIFRKVHPIPDQAGVFEGGVTPGDAFPAFDCDFGRLGILICWDMTYEESWDRVAASGAEIVVVPSASPQTLRPSAEALRHHFYVVTSTPKNNASAFDPIGRTIAQVTDRPGVFVKQIDLSYAILHWSENLHEGHGLTDRFGDKVGYLYSDREDTGVFWSNDPGKSIGEMIRALGLREMPVYAEDVERTIEKSRGMSDSPRK
ncbi:MAG TPA: carbon-nitrogen hydrolase family protein [Candidatus Didemnitutus sp.]|nr:carbon-nitrogen hydrolase family protein [Candidatus Didemnitutus sp.]